MIPLKEIIDLLCGAEFFNMHFVDMETHELVVSKVPMLVQSINLGVLDLHKRFTLKTGHAKINLTKGQFRYNLRPQYQVGTKGNEDKYIVEGDKLYPRSVLKIEKVFDECEIELPLRGPGYRNNVSTPENDSILLPKNYFDGDENRTFITVEYRRTGDPLRICNDDLDNWTCLKVDLPYTHQQALLYFVANRHHKPTGFSENSARETINYGQAYEDECRNLDKLNLRVDDVGTDDMIRRGGWA